MAQLCLSRGSFVSHETMCDVGVPFACCIQSLHYLRGGKCFHNSVAPFAGVFTLGDRPREVSLNITESLDSRLRETANGRTDHVTVISPHLPFTVCRY